MSKRIAWAFAALLFSAAAVAASVAERSPFAQGHWWNPQRSGEGFDIFNASGQVAVMWFTYDDAGKPIWYTAQGDDKSVGTPWPLLKHRWANGRKAGFTQAGTLKLEVNHPESMRVTWQIGAISGASNIEPFRASGVIGETDHSGSWFDPGNSGWGIAVVNQGEVLGGAVFTYDANGDPTWVAGFSRDPSSVEYFSTRGACPSCPYTSPQYTSAGRVRFEFNGENQAIVHDGLTVPMAAGVNMEGAKLVQLGRPASLRAADRQLANYDSDTALRQYLVAGMLNVPPMGGGTDFSASPPPAPVFSSTNLQEAGVDEPDVVKSDGRYVYTFGLGSWSGLGASIRVARVGDDVSSLDVVGSIPLAGGPNTQMAQAGLFLNGSTLIAITGTQPYGYAPWGMVGNWVRGTTSVEFFDVSAPERPASQGRIEMDGQLIASRRIGGRLYLVTRFVPNLPGFFYGVTNGPYSDSNRQLLANTPLAALMPAYRINGGASTPLVSPTNVYAPPQGARPPVADMVVVTAIDLSQMRMTQSLAILGAADTVYVSPSNLFLASSRYMMRTYSGALLPEPSLYLTDVHQVALGASQMTILASGSVEGYLGTDPDMAMFRLSEFQGKLRVATSSGVMWGPSTKNRLTILEPSSIAPGLLRTISYLPNASRPESLGKPGEFLHATRFVDDRLYAVTFKKIDPLYIVDLVNVSDPRITGTLDMPGFADYLHPLPNGLLLGFGKDAVPAGVGFGDGQFAWYQGLLLSVYDVSNAGAPREVQRAVMGKRGSDSALLKSHHAFSALQRPDGSWSIAMPVSIHDGAPSGSYGDPASTYYPWKESGLARFEIRGTSAANASLVQLPSLITNSVASNPAGGFYDAATTTARSVLFTNGSVYVANGQFWRLDRNGQQFGPY